MTTTNQVDVRPSTPILWGAALALAAVYGTLTLSWVIYRIQLPTLLTQHGFSAQFAPGLLLVESILAIALEPLAGQWSDQTEHQQGSRFPLISWSVIATSILFVLIPLVVLVTVPNDPSRWLLPTVLILWAIAISFFRAPVTALMRQYATVRSLPLIAGLLTLAGSLAGATAPLATPIILGWGTPATFTLLAILLIGMTAWLRSLNPGATSLPSNFVPNSESYRPSTLGQLAVIFGLGLTGMLAFRLSLETLSRLIQAQAIADKPAGFVGLVFLASAVAAIPAGMLATQLGHRVVMGLGLGGMAMFLILAGIINSTPFAVIVALGVGATFSLVSNGMFSLAVSLVPIWSSGQGMGALWGGIALATSLFTGVLTKPGVMSTPLALALGIGAIALAGACLVKSRVPSLNP